MANSTLKDRSGKNGNTNMRTLQTPVGPRESSIQSILNFSKALRVIETKQMGPIETVLN